MKFNSTKLLVYFLCTLLFSCSNDDENAEGIKSLLTSSAWVGPIEAEYHYYDKNDKLVESKFFGTREPHSFFLNNDYSALYYPCTEEGHSGEEPRYAVWQLKYKVLENAIDFDDQPTKNYLSGVFIPINDKIKNVSSSELILEYKSDYYEYSGPVSGHMPQISEISYIVRIRKYTH